jgi:glycosyltransferase involved in cell wall biosynthesis
MNVVWLASWFPNRTEPTSGDFIERQAVAMAERLTQLTVLVVVKDQNLPLNKVEFEIRKQGNLQVKIAYYGASSNFCLLEKYYSHQQYQKLQQQLWKEFIDQFGKPDICHVHVSMKAGWFARKQWLKYKIPYVVTEHWTGYYPQANPNFLQLDMVQRYMTRKVLQSAKLLLPVCDALAYRLNKLAPDTRFIKLSNVVDHNRFFYRQIDGAPIFRFIHFSYLNEQKNPIGIIDACKILHQKGLSFECWLVGNLDETLMKAITDRQLPTDQVKVLDAIPYEEVAKWMQAAQALLMFSKWENQPCVILEALSVGLPVISSAVGGIQEELNPSNGILVDSENVAQLAAAMEHMLVNYKNYQRKEIAEQAKQYSYPNFADKLMSIYNDINLFN